MTRGEKGVLIGTGLVVLGILVLEQITPKEPNWTESYTRYRTDPYATELVYDRLTDLFPQGVTTVHDPIYTTAQERLGTDKPPVVHFFIDRWSSLDALDLEHLLKMVAQGDDALLASDGFGPLADSLDVVTEYHWQPSAHQKMPGNLADVLRGDTASVRFTAWPLRNNAPYLFARGGFDSLIERFPLDSTQVLAVNAAGRPVLIRLAIGKGHLLLCTVPRAFTNYYLLKDEGRGFMEQVLALLPDRPVLWDEFYKVGRLESPTPLRFVLGRPALKAAYWTAAALLALYLFVYAKRRQRAIPEVVPLKNTSREFAETMGRLYYFKGDHADLARKMALYFKDDVRHKLYLRHAQWDEETVRHIAGRTGVDLAEWQHAFRLIDHYEKTPAVSEEQIIQFNKVLSRLRSRL